MMYDINQEREYIFHMFVKIMYSTSLHGFKYELYSAVGMSKQRQYGTVNYHYFISFNASIRLKQMWFHNRPCECSMHSLISCLSVNSQILYHVILVCGHCTQHHITHSQFLRSGVCTVQKYTSESFDIHNLHNKYNAISWPA